MKIEFRETSGVVSVRDNPLDAKSPKLWEVIDQHGITVGYVTEERWLKELVSKDESQSGRTTC